MSATGHGSDPISLVVQRIYDAALAPELWPDALQSVVEAVAAIDAAYVVWNKESEAVDWVSFSSRDATLALDYVRHYAAIDPYRPLVEAAPTGRWVRLSESVPEARLRASDWYNDFFVRRCGGGDLLGARLFDAPSHTGVFTIQQARRATPLEPAPAARLRRLVDAIANAARIHDQIRCLSLRLSVVRRGVNRVRHAVMIIDDVARVIELNEAAERMMRLDDGLAIRHGRLCGRQGSEAEKVDKLVAVVAANTPTGGAAGRMLIRRSGGRLPYCVTVTPLGVSRAFDDRGFAMVVVADPDQHCLPEKELAQLFGLTPAESRLAAALVPGNSPSDVAATFGLQITTLRSQIRSILKKVGVRNLTSLTRVVTSISHVG
jgi:DNA-binding CsgD family transcriptional regulator